MLYISTKITYLSDFSLMLGSNGDTTLENAFK